MKYFAHLQSHFAWKDPFGTLSTFGLNEMMEMLVVSSATH